ncbi:heptaprenyl diphosphate synthase component 1 [Paenibacillus cymbidii]|uniref:heptaprenyl diphosphate synthase component 1 n=1 Tax=Paenibacillus cymbidii TaxID=1639034 RepID=UPI001080DFD9|nr:heptaprenyl diphosphate synthase component 1 [Paenibacillus cymbidii]
MTNFPIPEMAKPYLEYDMIQNHTELPAFPEFRARLLYACLQSSGSGEAPGDEFRLPAVGGVRRGMDELYTLVTSLVQMGLDIHDMVPESSDRKEKRAARSRQLKVLAGDYFSAKFYHLLAQAGQIETIRHLSAAICEANRLKVNLYMLMKQWKLTAEEYVHQTVNIRMQLFLPFRSKMQGVVSGLWPDVLHSFTRCEVLAQEMRRLDSPQSLRGSWAYWHLWQEASKEERKQLAAEEPDPLKIRSLLHKYNAGGHLFHLLEAQVQHVWSCVKQLDSDKLMQEITQLVETFAAPLRKMKVLEER